MTRFIITTGGGLGNQIMSYALWIYLKKNKEKSILYLRRNSLSNIFSIKDVSKDNNSLLHIYIIIYKLYIRIINYIIKKVHCNKLSLLTRLLPYQVIDYPEWKDYKFISTILPILKEKLSFKPLEDKRNQSIQNAILKNNSVSIHIRRGDYQTVLRWRIKLGDICDIDYYEKAIEKVHTLTKDPTFFIFSDDINWARTNLTIKNAYYINWNTGDNSYIDMQLMAMCKINIIANSTFSLCATWLNINEQPIRIVPSKWQNKHTDNLLFKYIPESWIVINNTKPQISIIAEEEITQNEIKNILKQKYSDFELILKSVVQVKDSRIVINKSPEGRFLYFYKKNDSKNFKSRNYLTNWISIKLSSYDERNS